MQLLLFSRRLIRLINCPPSASVRQLASEELASSPSRLEAPGSSTRSPSLEDMNPSSSGKFAIDPVLNKSGSESPPFESENVDASSRGNMTDAGSAVTDEAESRPKDSCVAPPTVFSRGNEPVLESDDRKRFSSARDP